VKNADTVGEIVLETLSERFVALSRSVAEIMRLHIAIGTIDLNDSIFIQSIADMLGVIEVNLVDESGTIIASNLIITALIQPLFI
jgi:hypothetical protein